MCTAWGFICFINSPVREFKIKAYSLWFSLLALVGCGGGGTEVRPPAPPPPVQTTVSGSVFASDFFYNGEVRAYDFSNGVRGAQLASSSISVEGPLGYYQLTITGTAPTALLIEAVSGCYYEKGIFWHRATYGRPGVSGATVATVCTSTPAISAAVPFNATPLTVSVTPYTHAAVGLAQYAIRNGTATATAVDDANGRLSAWVGVNIITTRPALPVQSSSTVTDPLLYGSLLAGTSTWLQMKAGGPATPLGTGSLTTLAVASAMKEDLAHDGVLNGSASGGVVTIGNTAMSPAIYRHELAVGAVLRIRAETAGATSFPTLEELNSIVSFLPALEAYNNSVSSLFDNSAVIPLDEGGPIVLIGVPLAGATLSNDDGMAGYVNDIVGIQPGRTEMLIDNLFYAPFVDVYSPRHFINTTIFPNGPHLLTIRATNNLGHANTASVTVNFFN